jgi:hypothetical protein
MALACIPYVSPINEDAFRRILGEWFPPNFEVCYTGRR